MKFNEWKLVYKQTTVQDMLSKYLQWNNVTRRVLIQFAELITFTNVFIEIRFYIH